MITPEIKQKIVEAIKSGNSFGTQAAYARNLGVSASVLNRIFKGDTEKVLSDAHWVRIARKLEVQLKDGAEWKTARTPVFEFIYKQLEFCKEKSISRMLCDVADIGKTHTAKAFVKRTKNAVYIDCSQVKSKPLLVRKISKEFGLADNGRYQDVYDDLVFFLKSIDAPIVILDEAGDLLYSAFLELKALWNATEGFAAWYMIGADGLKEKVDRNIKFKKVGYTEIFSRFGKRYQSVTPSGHEEIEKFNKAQVSTIAKANGIPNTDIKGIYASSEGSLRRVKVEINKLRNKA